MSHQALNATISYKDQGVGKGRGYIHSIIPSNRKRSWIRLTKDELTEEEEPNLRIDRPNNLENDTDPSESSRSMPFDAIVNRMMQFEHELINTLSTFACPSVGLKPPAPPPQKSLRLARC